MRLTIIPSDGVVGVDGLFRPVSMAGIDPAIHAVQFDDLTNTGEIEYKQRGKSPDAITDRAAFQSFIARWTAAAPPPPPPPGPPSPPTEMQELEAYLKAKPSRLTALKALLP